MRDYSMVVSPELVGGSLTTPVIDLQLGTSPTQPVYSEPTPPIRGEEPISSVPITSQPINVSFPTYGSGGGVKDQLPIVITPVVDEPSVPTLPSTPTQPSLGLSDDVPPVKGSGASVVEPADVDAQIGGVVPPKSETPSTLIMPILGGAGGGAGEQVKKQLGKNWFWVAVAVGAGIYLLSRK